MKILLSIIVGIAAFVFFIWFTCVRVNLHSDIEDSGIWTDTIPKQYLQLLNLKDTCCKSGNIVLVNTLSNKYRSPVSRFSIDNKYYFQVYKMDSLFNLPLQQAIKENFTGSTMSYTVYADDKNTDMEFLYRLTKPHKPQNIYLALAGDSTRILQKNDTIAYYFSDCVNLSIRFKPGEDNDIFARCKSDNFGMVPLEILFLKKAKNLYMFILSSKNAGTTLKRGTLRDLLLNSKI